MIFIACAIALRIIGSPRRLTSLLRTGTGFWLRWSKLTNLPVINRPQVEAFTSNESLLPKCCFQSATDSLSRIKASAVALSGTRNSASARHINNTPSWVSKLYCCSSKSMLSTASSCWRTSFTSSAVFCLSCSMAAGGWLTTLTSSSIKLFSSAK